MGDGCPRALAKATSPPTPADILILVRQQTRAYSLAVCSAGTGTVAA